MKHRYLLSILVAAVLALPGCGPPEKKADAHAAPAKVPTIALEAQLNTVQLTAEAEKRLGLTLAPVEQQSIRRVRGYGGEITLPPGASLVISAPLGGKLQAASASGVPAVGSLVTAKQPIFFLTPLLSPERDVLTPAERIGLAQAKNSIASSQIDAAGQVQQARVQLEAAKIALDRAERLFRDGAGTARAVDDAKAQMSLAEKTLEAANSRVQLLASISLEGEAGKQTPLVIESPQAGLLRAQSATVGEVVAAGAPLFEVMRFDPVWIRVPVYSGETSELALDQPAQVLPLSSDERAEALVAKPVAAPPTATVLASTIDLYYELPNPAGNLRPGQRMTVRVELQGKSDQRVVPWSAVIHDIYGGTWVYENTAPLTFVRRRVQVKYVLGDKAVLETGPPTGAKIVTAGAVELYGAEFGFAK